MRFQSIFLLFYVVVYCNSQFDIRPEARLIYNQIITSKTLFKKSSNDSTDVQKILKSFNPSVKVKSVMYYFLPESIGYAAYDHPEAVDLTNYNQSCLKSWAKKFNNTIENCLGSFREKSFCTSMNKVDTDECDYNEYSQWNCHLTVVGLGDAMDEIVFPDGRSVESVIWNCSSKEECSGYGCHLRVPSSIVNYLPHATTPSPLQSARDILYILLKVCIISSVVCFVLSLIIRYHAYLHRRTVVQTAFLSPQALPTPPKSDFTSFPPPSYPPPQAPVYSSHPSSEPPPPYVLPPPYTDQPIQPLPKVV